MCLPLCTCRYVRFTQTKGHEAFTLRFASCSYTSSVPFQYRDGGIMGVYTYMLPCICLVAFMWWVRPRLPCFSLLFHKPKSRNREGLGTRQSCMTSHTGFLNIWPWILHHWLPDFIFCCSIFISVLCLLTFIVHLGNQERNVGPH